jgi:hypothetical protein
VSVIGGPVRTASAQVNRAAHTHGAPKSQREDAGERREFRGRVHGRSTT